MPVDPQSGAVYDDTFRGQLSYPEIPGRFGQWIPLTEFPRRADTFQILSNPNRSQVLNLYKSLERVLGRTGLQIAKSLEKKGHEKTAGLSEAFLKVLKKWNPNLGKELFGKEFANAAKEKGLTIVTPDFGPDVGAEVANFFRSMAKSKIPFLSSSGEALSKSVVGGWGLEWGGAAKSIKDRVVVLTSGKHTAKGMRAKIPELNSGVPPRNIRNLASDNFLKVSPAIENKEIEAALFSEIGKTLSLGEGLKKKDKGRILEYLNREFPKGWVLKKKDGGSTLTTKGGKSPEIFFSGDANVSGVNKLWGKRKDWIVQGKKDLQKKGPILEFLDKTLFPKINYLSGNEEFRVHVANGQVVPYATVHRGSALKEHLAPLIPWRSKNERAAEEYAQSVFDNLPKNKVRKILREGSYGLDVAIKADGTPTLIETNPSGTGTSGFFSSPIVIDAIRAKVLGKLPIHVKARRGLYAGLAGGGALAAGAPVLPESGDGKEPILVSGEPNKGLMQSAVLGGLGLGGLVASAALARNKQKKKDSERKSP